MLEGYRCVYMESGHSGMNHPLMKTTGLSRPQIICPLELLAACGHAMWAIANGRGILDPSDVNLAGLETTPAGLRGWANYWHMVSSNRSETNERSSGKDVGSDKGGQVSNSSDRGNNHDKRDDNPGVDTDSGDGGAGGGHWTVYTKSRLGRYSATWTEASRPSTEAIRAWLAEDMNMPIQKVRLRVELGHMCTHAKVFPRLSGGGPKRRRRGNPPPPIMARWQIIRVGIAQ